MNVALTIACLVIGASVVEPPTGNNSNLPGIAPPTSSIPLQPELRSAIQKHTRTPTRGVPASHLRRNASPAAASPSPTLPVAPTDSNAEVGQQYQYLPPTAGASRAAMGSGRSSGFYGQSRMPYSPTHPQPGQAQSNAGQNAQLQRMKIEAASQAIMPARQPVNKAFSGAQTYSTGVSPYMNLYRLGNAAGTIDNYNTLVRPQLDQRRTNQQFNTDINNLESSSRVQGFNINQLNRDTSNLQGVKYQQYFMNYGDFYPGAR